MPESRAGTAGLLSGQVAVITGAASGMGRSIALAFARHGAEAIVVADVRSDPREGGAPTDEMVKELGAKSVFVQCDVTERSDLEAAIEAADAMGGLDVMVNNAGILEGRRWRESPKTEFMHTMEINVAGVFLGAQVAADHMLPRGTGVIINMCSIAGLIGSGDYVAYSTSKGAVKMLTASLASTLGRSGVRVNAIAPGYIDTALNRESSPVLGSSTEANYSATIAMGRWGMPDEVAGCAVFLASPLSSYVHGETLVVDGGVLNCRTPKLTD